MLLGQPYSVVFWTQLESMLKYTFLGLPLRGSASVLLGWSEKISISRAPEVTLRTHFE